MAHPSRVSAQFLRKAAAPHRCILPGGAPCTFDGATPWAAVLLLLADEDHGLFFVVAVA